MRIKKKKRTSFIFPQSRPINMTAVEMSDLIPLWKRQSHEFINVVKNITMSSNFESTSQLQCLIQVGRAGNHSHLAVDIWPILMAYYLNLRSNKDMYSDNGRNEILSFQGITGDGRLAYSKTGDKSCLHLPMCSSSIKLSPKWPEESFHEEWRKFIGI